MRLQIQLACLLVGRSLQNIPGPTWWNPGPYSIVSLAINLNFNTTFLRQSSHSGCVSLFCRKRMR
jgi:hypothetical protein